MYSAITIENVSKRFKHALALDGVTFDVPRGEIFGLLGPNGAGKTTLMRILTGILGPDEGVVHFYENSTKSLKERIGYLPEERGLYPKMKVREMLEFCGAIKGMNRGSLSEEIPKGLERVGLTGIENRRIEELSKGNQQRIQLLITLLHQPDVLILDEPFTALDPMGVDQMKRILAEETLRGATVIISTHGMKDAEQLCKSIALIHHGKLLRYGELKEIKAREGREELIIHYRGDSEAIPQMAGIELTEMDSNRIRLRLNNGYSVPQIIREFSNRLEVYSVTSTEPTLHDLFVKLVGFQED